MQAFTDFDDEGLGRVLFAESSDALILFDPRRQQILDVNPMAERLTGRSRGELLFRPLMVLVHEDEHAALRRLLEGASRTTEKFRLRGPGQGVSVPVQVHLNLLEGKLPPVGLLTMRGLHEDGNLACPGQEAKTALGTGEGKYRALVENLEQCVFLKDAALRFIAVNKPFCQALGLAEEAILGKTDLDFYPPRLAEKYRADDRRILAEGGRIEVEEQNLCDGQLRTVRVVKTPVRDNNGRIVGVLGIFWDVTEQRALEGQLRQAGKMEAVGQLAGGVAHDFNNLLTAILGNLSLIAASLPASHPSREMVATAEKAALRAATLTRQLLGFSRQNLLRPQCLYLNGVVEEVVAILRRTIDPRITLEVRPSADTWPVHADPSQMTQVLMNLCLNARDAMTNGGRLLLEIDNVGLDDEYVRYHVEAQAGDFVRLRVSDTGHGIAPDVLPRIFEPFFTTKEVGKGTGLGLALVFGIVKQHQGWINCYSEVGHGTCFHIYLPRQDQPDLAMTPPPVVQRPCHGHETVLLVDDEPVLRNMGRAILQRYGYQVLLAADGQEAVELYGRDSGQIDLVILDLTMPRLSGLDASRQILQADPEARILFASGYSAEHVMHGEDSRILGFVSKPYRPEDLARAVRAALDHEQGRGETEEGAGLAGVAREAS